MKTPELVEALEDTERDLELGCWREAVATIRALIARLKAEPEHHCCSGPPDCEICEERAMESYEQIQRSRPVAAEGEEE